LKKKGSKERGGPAVASGKQAAKDPSHRRRTSLGRHGITWSGGGGLCGKNEETESSPGKEVSQGRRKKKAERPGTQGGED